MNTSVQHISCCVGLPPEAFSMRRPTLPRKKTHLYIQASTRSYEQYTKLNVPPKIHILGSGAVGKLIAHSLLSLPEPPPVTLLYHRDLPYQEMLKAKETLTLTRNRFVESRQGFDTELIAETHRRYRPNELNKYSGWNRRTKSRSSSESQPIHNLVISLRAFQVVGALSSLAHRLSAKSSILFLNAGMGVVEEVNKTVFPDPKKRPSYMLGVSSHGVSSNGVTHATHYTLGTIQIGLVPREANPRPRNTETTSKPVSNEANAKVEKATKQSNSWPLASRYLLRTIARSPVLAAVAVSPTDIIQAQLETLAVMCLIEPLTTMLDCRNGSLLDNFAASRTFTLLLAEINLVIRALPELQGVVNVPMRFSPERLQARTVAIARKTALQVSSTLRQVRRGGRTEIEYLNGYIVRRGEELGFKPAMNYMVMQMVVAKQQMVSREVDRYMPQGGVTAN